MWGVAQPLYMSAKRRWLWAIFGVALLTAGVFVTAEFLSDRDYVDMLKTADYEIEDAKGNVLIADVDYNDKDAVTRINLIKKVDGGLESKDVVIEHDLIDAPMTRARITWDALFFDTSTLKSSVPTYQGTYNSTKDLNEKGTLTTAFTKNIADETTLDPAKVGEIEVPLNKGGAYFFGTTSTRVGTSAGSIGATGSTTRSGISDKLIRNSTGALSMAYTDDGSDIWTAYSLDNGTTWTSAERNAGTYNDVACAINSANFILCIASDNGNDNDLVYFNSTDGLASVSPITQVPNMSGIAQNDFILPSIQTDAYDQFQIVSIADVLGGSDGNDSVIYINETSGNVWSNPNILYNNAVDDADYADIAVNSTGGIFIAFVGSDESDMDMIIGVNGSFPNPKFEVYADTVVMQEFDLEVSPYNNNLIYILWAEYGTSDDLQFSNSSNGGATWTTVELNTTGINRPDLAVDSAGTLHAVWQDGGTGAGKPIYSNSTNNGTSWLTTIELDQSVNMESPHIRFSAYPTFNRMNCGADAYYSNATGIWFRRLYAPCEPSGNPPEPPENTCTYSGTGNWNILCSDNCNITSNVAMGGNNVTVTGTGYLKLTANVTNYKKLYIKGADASNRCNVYCLNGGCFRQ